MSKREVVELTWQDARAEVKQVNPELAAIIDKISPDKRYKLIKVTYHFGDLIVKDGVLQVPFINNELSAITSRDLSKNLRSALNYSTIPLSLLLTKSSEVFVQDDARIIPLNMLSPGQLFGTFETLDYIFERLSKPIWNVSAGARSIFMLPKITEASGFKRLRNRYNISLNTRLKYLNDHWHVFKQIAAHEDFPQCWTSKILFFSKEWLMIKKNDSHWFEFQRYIFQQGWYQSQYAINKIQFGLFWQLFIKAINNRNLKPTPYLADTLKHLLLIATGGAPAFRVADTSQLAAPIESLQKAFIEIYQLKAYLPTVVYPHLLDIRKDLQAVYYSLALPTLLEGTPNNNKNTTTLMLDIKDIKLLIETLLRELQPEQNLIPNIEFEYFHSDEDKYGEIQSSKLIPELDPNFLIDTQTFPDRIFCSTSSFWKGCIRISKK